MESLQIFTIVLLAVGSTHLVFSTVEVCEKWLMKKYPAFRGMSQKMEKISRSGWYVFFDPADIYGKPVERRSDQKRTKSNATVRRPSPRVSVRL